MSNLSQIDYTKLPSGFRERVAQLFLLCSAACVVSSDYIFASLSFNQLIGQTIQTWYVVEIWTFIVFIFIAILYYSLHPILTGRSFGEGTPLDKNTDVWKACSSIAKMANVGTVGFDITSNPRQQNAISFGYPKNRRVRLGGGMRFVNLIDPQVFKNVLSHEVSHIVNRDIEMAYFSRGMVLSLFLLVLLSAFSLMFNWLPIIIGGNFVTRDFPFYAKIILIFVLVFGLIICIAAAEYASILRSRELYADRAAASLTDYSLPDNSNETHSVSHGPVKELLLSVFRFHPPIGDRSRILNNPHELLYVDFSQLVLTGYFGALVAAQVQFMFNRHTTHVSSGAYDSLETFFNYLFQSGDSMLLLSLVITMLSVCVWLAVAASINLRAIFVVILENRSVTDLFAFSAKFGVGCMAGFFLGQFINPISLYNFLLAGQFNFLFDSFGG